MSSLIIDNWSLDTFFGPLSNASSRSLYSLISTTNANLSNSELICWQNLLMAIVLWDDIRFIMPRHGYSLVNWDNYTSIIKPIFGSVIKPLYNENEDRLLTIPQVEHDIAQIVDMLYRDKYPNHISFETTVEFMEQCKNLGIPDEYLDDDYSLYRRTTRYLAICNRFGSNFLPHPYRGTMMRETRMMSTVFNRSNFIFKVDKSVLGYYDELNNRLQEQLLRCSYPLLYDFIRKNSNTLSNELNSAFELREDKDIVAFRKSVDTLDMKINSGDITSLDFALRQVEELSREIMEQRHETITLGELSIGLSPSLNIPIRISGKKKKIINMSFLSRLADFGVHERLKR